MQIFKINTKVICVSNRGLNIGELTINKEYTILNSYMSGNTLFYQVISDRLQIEDYFDWRFKLVNTRKNKEYNIAKWCKKNYK